MVSLRNSRGMGEIPYDNYLSFQSTNPPLIISNSSLITIDFIVLKDLGQYRTT